MDAFILPSIYEGLPVVLIEAQAAGLRCFASEAVTKEADITGRVIFLPINDWGKWKMSISQSDLSHIDTYDAILRSGYDIRQTSADLQSKYMLIAANYHGRGYNY